MARTKAKTIAELEEEQEEQAIRLKIIAEEKYKRSKLKSALKYAKKAHRLCPHLDGISAMVTSFNILYIYSKSPSSPDWYSILEVEPFSHINSIKKQYKKLALVLHPDKSPCIASEEAFKRVSEANQVLSDKIRRKEYDLKLRIALQAKATAVDQSTVVDTFWTTCSRCPLFHQFDRRYIGRFLRCPSCKMSFLAEEVEVKDGLEDDVVVKETNIRVRVRTMGNHSVDNEKHPSIRTMGKHSVDNEKQPIKRSTRIPIKRKFDFFEDVSDSAKRSRVNLRSRVKKVVEEREMTLAEMQLAAKRKSLEEKAKKVEMAKAKEREERNTEEKERMKEKGKGKQQREKEKGKEKTKGVVANLQESGNLEVMVVEDSDFHDFDKDRTGRCFKKAQIWAVYDDDDGMPRHYGLIDEVESVNPFVVKLSWLDMESNEDERLLYLEKSGFHISCGRFKVSRKIVVDSVNVFSHLVLCERVAREIYWIYPRKGSIWALYSERGVNGDEGHQISKETRSYDIVISLTSYSEMHGLSMAYLDKVEGFRTIFKRREIGSHAIRWLEKDDLRLYSHQIPAKKLSGTEARDLPRDCWELDPASLPPDMLRIGWGE